MSTYKEQDIENLLAHLREGIASDSVLALADDIRVDCEGAGDGESVWMHPVLPGARYGKEDKVIYDPFDTLPGRSLKSSGGLPMVEFYLHRGDDRPDATRNVKDMEPAPYLIGRYYMKTLLADHLDRGILLQDMPRLTLSADTVADVQDALAKAVRAYAAACDFEIDGADADIARCLAQGGGRAAGAKVSAVYVPVGDLPRETTVFPDMARAAASIGLEDPETETLAEYGGVTVSLVRAADAEGSELKPNRAWVRGGATEIVRGGFLVIGYPIITQTHRRGLICGRRRQNPDRHPSFDRPATAFARRGARCRHTLVRARQVEKTGHRRGDRMQRGSDNERRDRTEMQRQRDRDYAKELCASRLAFTLSRTGTSKEDYCRAVGISSSTLSRILNRQTLMSTSTLIETARYFEDTSVSWFLGL